MKKIITYLFGFLAFTSVILTSCEDDEFNYPVDISSQSVESAYPLERVTIEGTNFNTVQFVFVGTLQANFEIEESGAITFEIPASADAGMTTVTLAMANNYRETFQIEVLQRPFPVIERISPSAGAPGESITIAGSSLGNLETITVGEVEASVVSNTGTELVFTVPDGLPNNTPQIINIVTSGGEVESESIFYVGDNLVANGEFEEGTGDDFTNWGKWNGGDGLTATTVANEAYYGRSLKAVAVGGDAWRTQFASDPAQTQIGVEYTLFMWIKAEAGSPGDGGNIRFSTSPDAMYSDNYDINSEWQQIEWVFTANAAETSIVLDLGVITDAIYFIDNVTLIATGIAGPQPVELMLNGGFELGDGDDFTNWNKFNGADLLTATTNPDEVRSGDRALRAVGAGADAWRTQLATDVMVTEPGTGYLASLWIKGEGSGIGGSVRMSTAGNGDAQYQGSFTVTGEWQLIEWNITANSTETQLVLDMGATADAVYFVDDVSFEAPPEEPAANLALNPGFEEGDGDEFTNWNKFNGADLLTATIADDEVHKGSRALKAVGFGGDAWRTQMATDVMATEAGTSYTASIWIKAEEGSPGVGGAIRMSTAGNGDAQYQGDVTVTADWQQVLWTITANGTETQLVLDLGFTENAVYFIDDVEFKED